MMICRTIMIIMIDILIQLHLFILILRKKQNIYVAYKVTAIFV